MADQASQPQSIQARIAALNVGHVGRAPITATVTNWGEDAQERPSLEQRRTTVGFQTISPNGVNGVGNEPNGPKQNGVLPPPTITRTGQQESTKPSPLPRLPPRRASTQASPALPPRRSSNQAKKRDSTESISSTVSAVSSISNPLNVGTSHGAKTPSVDSSRMMAPVFDPSKLPPLPPKRPTTTEAEKARTPLGTRKGSHDTTNEAHPVKSTTPSLPPSMLPHRDTTTRKLPPATPPPKPGRPGMPSGLRKSNDNEVSNDPHDSHDDPHAARPPSLRPDPPTVSNRAPPPVPRSSRPDLTSIMASKPNTQKAYPQKSPVPQISSNMPRLSVSSSSKGSCLLCRDFSSPDAHAAKFPRHSVPSLDWLALQLTSPFSDSPTDCARAIFTWLHYNISYDVEAFFNKRCQGSTPASTLSTGLAVCEGYAGLFTALALKAGLESVTVSGHGKGFGFSHPNPGDPIPGEFSTHAWNAVRIDDGEWKLIDCCWGAGYVQGKGKPYVPKFNPHMFTVSNDLFGWRHFPTNRGMFFRSDGAQMDWSTYYLGPTGTTGEAVKTFNVLGEEGIDGSSLQPSNLHIPIPPISSSSSSFPTTKVHFQFNLLCPHFTPHIHGPGPAYVYILAIHGLDGRKDDYIALDTDGKVWWADVEAKMLGCRGQHIMLYAVNSVQGGDGRGLGVREFREEVKGKKGMGFAGVARWDLV